MKTIVRIGALCLTFLQAGESRVEQILQDYMDAWNEHNITKIEQYYSPHVIWYDLPSDTTTKGKKRVSKAITEAFMGYVPDMYWVKSGDLFVSGNTVTYEWVYGGTFNGMWGNEKVEKKSFSIKGISTTTVDAQGKIISQKDYYDLYGFEKQLGIIK